MFFKVGVLKNFVIFSVKHLCWSLFFFYQKETPTQVLSWEYCKLFENSFFVEPPMAGSEGFHHGFFTGKFPDGVKLYQQLELEYLNQRRWWDVLSVLWVYLMLIKFDKNYFRHLDLIYFLAEQYYKKNWKKHLVLQRFPWIESKSLQPRKQT